MNTIQLSQFIHFLPIPESQSSDKSHEARRKPMECVSTSKTKPTEIP